MNEEYVLLSDYNTLKMKYCEQGTRMKLLQNENSQLKRILDEFNEVIRLNEEAKKNIEKNIKEIYKKIESKKSKECFFQLSSFSLSFDSIYDIEYIDQSLSLIENEYKILLKNFKEMRLKYNVLYCEYTKCIGLNSKLININNNNTNSNHHSNEVLTNEKKTEDTNQTKDISNKKNISIMCEGLCSMLSVNDETEPIPTIVKCLKKLNQ